MISVVIPLCNKEAATVQTFPWSAKSSIEFMGREELQFFMRKCTDVLDKIHKFANR